METTDTRATAFGRVLSRLMEARGIPAEPEEMRALAERSGFDGEKFLVRVRVADAPDFGHPSGLARELGLSGSKRGGGCGLCAERWVTFGGLCFPKSPVIMYR